MSKVDNVLREFVRGVSDDDLRYISGKFQREDKDRASIAEFMEKRQSVDRWLSTANSATEWFDMLDLLGDSILKEVDFRKNRKKNSDEAA